MELFAALLEDVTHDAYIAFVIVLSLLTITIVLLAIRRILPRRVYDPTLPDVANPHRRSARP